MTNIFNYEPFLRVDGKILVFDWGVGTREATPEELAEFGL